MAVPIGYMYSTRISLILLASYCTWCNQKSMQLHVLYFIYKLIIIIIMYYYHLTNCISTCLHFLMSFDVVTASVAMTAIVSHHFNCSRTENKRICLLSHFRFSAKGRSRGSSIFWKGGESGRKRKRRRGEWGKKKRNTNNYVFLSLSSCTLCPPCASAVRTKSISKIRAHRISCNEIIITTFIVAYYTPFLASRAWHVYTIQNMLRVRSITQQNDNNKTMNNVTCTILHFTTTPDMCSSTFECT